MTTAFESEIRQQPDVLRALLDSAAEPVAEVAARVQAQRPRALLIVGRGTSAHASIHAQYLFETRNSIPVSLVAPSVYTRYGGAPHLTGMMMIGISQSGESTDVLEVLQRGHSCGARTLAITNNGASRLARFADQALVLSAGDETSIPASKTFTATVVVLNMLSAALNPEPGFDEALRALPGLIGEVVEKADVIGHLARDFSVDRSLIVGRGFQLAAALETALKLCEAGGVGATGISAAELLHGPIASIHERVPALILDDGGPDDGLRERLLGRGCTVRTVGNNPDADIAIPRASHLAVEPVVSTVAGQLLALAVAENRGRNPDEPPGLRKITETR